MKPKVLMAAALDPRTKNLGGWLHARDVDAIWDSIITTLVDETLTEEQALRAAAAVPAAAAVAPFQEVNRPRNLYDRMQGIALADNNAAAHAIRALITRADVEDRIRLEVTGYRNEPVLPMFEDPNLENRVHTNPLSWWMLKVNIYLRLSALAKRYQCIPATSAPSERLFSHAGLTISKKRAALKPENAQAIVFLHDNLEFLERQRGGFL